MRIARVLPSLTITCFRNGPTFNLHLSHDILDMYDRISGILLALAAVKVEREECRDLVPTCTSVRTSSYP